MSYTCIICKLENVRVAKNSDNLAIGDCLGNPVIVSKDYPENMIGVYFPCDGLLSQEFCKANNLFPVLDKDGKRIGGGFFDSIKPRVRAQKFRGNRSMGFFIGLDSLKFTAYDLDTLKIGDSFDSLDGVTVCSKYINPATFKALNERKRGKKQPIAPLFFEHKDTDQFDYYSKEIPVGAIITLSNKSHGTSGRYSYTTVNLTVPLWKRIINKVMLVFPTSKNEYVVGTRRTVLLSEDENKEGFHGSEAFRYNFLSNVRGKLPLNMTIYLEIRGWANNKPIMSPHSLDKNDLKSLKNKYPSPMYFSYANLEGQCDYSVYRITLSGNNGDQFDLSWDQVKAFCKKNDLKCAFELTQSFVYDGNLEELKKKVYSYLDVPDPEDGRHYSEGVVVRVDFNGVTSFYKKKGFYFSIGEGICKDSGSLDIEEAS